MSNNYNNLIENNSMNKDLFKSLFIHVGLVGIIWGSYFLEHYVFTTSKTVISQKEVGSKQNSLATENHHVNSLDHTPINASLIDQELVAAAVKRQQSEDQARIGREKKLKQQENQLAQLKKMTEQEALKLKQEREKIKKFEEKSKQDKEQLKKQQEELQKTAENLKNQAKDLALKQEKLNKLNASQAAPLAQKKNFQETRDHQVGSSSQTKVEVAANGSAISKPGRMQSLGSNYVSGGETGEVGINSVHGEVASYQAKWKADIINNRKKFMLFPTNMFCAIRIKLLADGKLSLVKVEKSSGNAAYDAFSAQAIYKSEPFQMSHDPVVNKELTETDHIIEFDDKEVTAG